MTGKRQSARRSTVLYLKVVDEETEEEIGRLADLSREGALIVTAKPLEANGTYHVRIALPPFGIGGHPHLEGTLHHRWSRPDRNPELTLNGCLYSVDPEFQPALDQLIERYGFSDGTIDFRRRYEAGIADREKE
jgi:hypothetical protein